MSSEKCWVYVVELDGGTLYVGSTCKTIRERVAEHREQRGKARLRRDLFRGGHYVLSREAAERAERELAEKLRRRGFDVRQG